MEETNEKLWCVYIHTNKINNKVYIGVAKGNPKTRWGKNGNGYSRSQPVFARAIKKYTWDGFEHEVVAQNLTQREAWDMEIELIAQYKSNCKRYENPSYGYNMTDGGEGTRGIKLSDERKQQLRERQIKRFENPEERERVSKWAKERLSIPENNPMFGKHHSEESRELISKKVKEGMQDEKLRKKLSNLKKGIYDGKNNPSYGSGKAVVQLTTQGCFVAEYISGFDAYVKTGISYSGIYKCCNGQQITAGGFKWANKEDYDNGNMPKVKTRKSKKSIPIVQMSLSGDFIAEYHSMTEATNITNVDRGSISLCCLNRSHSAGGFKWMYKADYDKLTQQNDLTEEEDEI